MSTHYPVGASPFEKQVDVLLSVWLKTKDGSVFDSLAALLGCSLTEEDLTPPYRRSEADEKVILSTWQTVFDALDPSTSDGWWTEVNLFVAMLHSDKWKTFFDTPARALRFTLIAARYFWSLQPEKGIPQKGADAVRYAAWLLLQSALSPWLPARSENEIFTLRCMASALFGEAWCVLIYDAREKGTSMATMIETTCPAFLPGRLTTGYAVTAAELPELGCPSV